LSKHIRTKRQAKFEKRALKKLVKSGLYTGKIDLRRAPTKYQRQIIVKFSNVVSGKAVAVRPKNPKTYRKLFETRGKIVIVPSRKGEKITVDIKSGEIVGKRKVGKRIVRSRYKHRLPGAKSIRKSNVQYALPFNAGGGETRWQRFPTFDMLEKFMAGYDYKDWTDYVVEERLGAVEDDEALQAKLDRQLARKKRGRKKRL